MNQRKLAGQKPNPLLSRFDLDPGKWRPLYYGVEISVGVIAGGQGIGSITVNNQPYILQRIATKIIGNTANPSVSGLYQDGQYDLSWRDEQSNYQNQQIPADLLFGSQGAGAGFPTGYIMELTYPIAYSGNRTLTFEITNRVTRTLVPQADYFSIYVACHGIGDWGQLGPRG